jgi:hypothetical protein
MSRRFQRSKIASPSRSMVGERGRIVAGEAVVGELRAQRSRPQAHRAVDAVDRQEGQRIRADEGAHLFERMGGGEQLVALGRVDAVDSRDGVIGGLAMRMCTSRAPASRIICTIFTEVVPRTMESSTSTMRLPATTARLALCLSRTPSADLLGRLDEGAADIVVADDAELEGDAGGLREAERAGTPESGTGTTTSASTGASRGEFAPMRLAHLVDRAAADDGIGAGEIDVLEDARPRRQRRERLAALDAVLGEHHHLAVLDVAHEAGADDVERAGLRRQDRAAVELAQHQRADAERIAGADQLLVGQADEANRRLRARAGPR